ncbi:MAG: M36 family metallopeptidase [Rhodothermales bacterium]|nr:M36 family metallopeptidase [Rhodothermales bacterium]
MARVATLLLALLLFAGMAAETATAQTEQARTIALRHLDQGYAALGLTRADVADRAVSNAYTSRHNGVSHVYIQQRYDGIGVHNALITINVKDGRVFSVGNRFVADLAGKVSGASGLSAIAAAEAAAEAVGLAFSEPLQEISTQPGADRPTLLTTGGTALEPIPARLTYLPLDDGTVQLAWRVGIYTSDAQHYWDVFVDAGSGTALEIDDAVIHDSFGEAPASETAEAPSFALSSGLDAFHAMTPDQYRVYPMPAESPNHPFPGGTPHTLVTDPALDGGTLPAGITTWHDTDGVAGAEFTDTRGNNVDAYLDLDANNVPDAGSRPDGGAPLIFDFAANPDGPGGPGDPPSAFRPAAVVNLFYWNNITHDVLWNYGFDEASGNFQVNNYGRGGLGGDDVRAEAQDGGGTCNANFLTLPDGSRPRMQMFVCGNRDGDFDNGVIVHEYGHGISIRLTGGPATTSCLFNQEQAGEGWSDWYGLMLTQQPTHTETTSRGIGTYLFGQPGNGPGIRARPYTTDMAVNEFTYDNIKTASVPHGVGHVWSTMLWDLNWALIGTLFPSVQGSDGAGGGFGFDPDFYGGTGGNNLLMQLVTDGLKLQPCSPGFVDSRNAIIEADEALFGGDGDWMTPDGLNACAIWSSFARRGLGFSASQGSSGSRSDGTEAFDFPPGLPNPCTTAAPSFTINVDKLKRTAAGTKKVKISWNAATVSTNKVDFYVAIDPATPSPDGNPKDEDGGKRTSNDGKTAVKLKTGQFPTDGPFNIQACEKKSTTVCSNTVQVDFTGVPIDFDEPEDDPDDEGAASKFGEELPEDFALAGNYPNPFNPSTTLRFDLPESALVSVEVYDVLGRRVLTVPAQQVAAGAARTVQIDGSTLASGVYLYRLTAQTETDVHIATGRMTLAK